MRKIKLGPLESRVAFGLVAAGWLVTLSWTGPESRLSVAAHLGLAIPVVAAALALFVSRTWARLVPAVVLTPLVAIGALQFAPGWIAALVALIRLDRRPTGSVSGSRLDRFATLAAVLALTLLVVGLLAAAARHTR